MMKSVTLVVLFLLAYSAAAPSRWIAYEYATEAEFHSMLKKDGW